MSLRDELNVTLSNHSIKFSDLKIDKNDDYKGRACTTVGFIINGFYGPVFYDTSITDDLKLPDTEQAELIARNAKHAYANHATEMERIKV